MRQLHRVPWWVWVLAAVYYVGALEAERFMSARGLLWAADAMWATYFMPAVLLAYFAGLPGAAVAAAAVGLPLWLQAERLDYLLSFRTFQAGPLSSLLIGIETAIVLTGLLVDRLRHEQRTGECDPLTGVLNRRRLEPWLHHADLALLPDAQGSKPLAVLMLDLDDFKRCNDRWGHEAGDLLLQAFARALRESVRASDLAVRYGGDEFVVILVGAGRKTALEVLGRLQVAMAASRPLLPEPIRGPNGDGAAAPVSLTFSAGVALYPEHGRSFKELLRLADQALYEAKRRGRRCVVFADAVARPSDADSRALDGAAATGEIREALSSRPDGPSPWEAGPERARGGLPSSQTP